MVQPVGSHPSSSQAAESTSLEDSAMPVAEQSPDVAVPVAAAAAVASSGAAPVSDAAVPQTRKKRKKRRATSDASQHPAVSATSSRAAQQRGAGQIVPFAAAAAAVIGGALLLRRLLRRTSAQQQQTNGGDPGPAADARSVQRSDKQAGNVVDIPVVGAPPALVLELDPPLRRGADATNGGARPLLDGLTFAVSDVYVPGSDCLGRTTGCLLLLRAASVGRTPPSCLQYRKVLPWSECCMCYLGRSTDHTCPLSPCMRCVSPSRHLHAAMQTHAAGCRRFDIEGMVTRSGRDAGVDDPPPAAATAAALQLLVDAGAVGVAKSATPPMNLGCAPRSGFGHLLLTRVVASLLLPFRSAAEVLRLLLHYCYYAGSAERSLRQQSERTRVGAAWWGRQRTCPSTCERRSASRAAPRAQRRRPSRPARSALQWTRIIWPACGCAGIGAAASLIDICKEAAAVGDHRDEHPCRQEYGKHLCMKARMSLRACVDGQAKRLSTCLPLTAAFAQVAAACCGLYGVRPSQGAVPGDGVAMASGRLEHVAWAAADPDVLYRVGQAMNLPGGALLRLRRSSPTQLLKSACFRMTSTLGSEACRAESMTAAAIPAVRYSCLGATAAGTLISAPAGSKAARTELVRILIAKDIFDGCEGATKAVYRALVAAARQWATEEQVTAVWPGSQPSAYLVAAHALCRWCLQNPHGIAEDAHIMSTPVHLNCSDLCCYRDCLSRGVIVLALLGLKHLRVALQVPLLRYLEDRVPGLATVAKDAGGGDDGEPLQQTVLDALTDAAEALQVLDVQRRYPDALGDTQPVGTCRIDTRTWEREFWPVSTALHSNTARGLSSQISTSHAACREFATDDGPQRCAAPVM